MCSEIKFLIHINGWFLRIGGRWLAMDRFPIQGSLQRVRKIECIKVSCGTKENRVLIKETRKKYVVLFSSIMSVIGFLIAGLETVNWDRSIDG
jgi:hypothetical protein